MYQAPSGSHCDRCPDNAKTALLNRMYKVEAVHFGTPKEEFISPVKGGNMKINPITMTRMGLSSEGAKEFNDLYLKKRFKRLTKDNTNFELFTGDHMMHPGGLGLGLVSSSYQPSELNPHYNKSVSQSQYLDPRAVIDSSKTSLVARQEWLKEEHDDINAVMEETAEAKRRRDAARKSMNLQLSGNTVANRRRGAGHQRASAVSTSFVRRPEIAYETSYRRSFSTFGEHDKAALNACPHPSVLQPKIAAVSQGQAHPMRDLKYGEFTSQCDLPHRKLEAQLHPIGLD